MGTFSSFCALQISFHQSIKFHEEWGIFIVYRIFHTHLYVIVSFKYLSFSVKRLAAECFHKDKTDLNIYE